MIRKSLGKRIGVMTTALVMMCSAAFAAQPPQGVEILKFDRPAEVSAMPGNFRTCQSDFQRVHGDIYPTREGLDTLRDSGSSFYSKNEFKTLLSKLPADKKDIIVLDMRCESHGYINDNGISWYSWYQTANKGRTADQIDAREHELLNEVKKAGTVDLAVLTRDKSIAYTAPIKVDSVMTEKEFVESQGIKYYRVPLMDYTAPDKAVIDRLVAFKKSLPENAWVHVHCEAGIGRTTITLSLLDMMSNASKLSFDEIMSRQVLLGSQSEDVRKSAALTTDEYKKVHYAERATCNVHGALL